jgi:hypothetical protein
MTDLASVLVFAILVWLLFRLINHPDLSSKRHASSKIWTSHGQVARRPGSSDSCALIYSCKVLHLMATIFSDHLHVGRRELCPLWIHSQEQSRKYA